MASGVRCVAVASRDLAKAERFLRECEGDAEGVKVMGYEELLAAGEADAVYVPLPTGLHLEWVKKIAAAGKHILLEKPLSLTTEALSEMWDTCKAAGVVVLDGTMFTHHPRMHRLREEIEKLGPVLEVTTRPFRPPASPGLAPTTCPLSDTGLAR